MLRPADELTLEGLGLPYDAQPAGAFLGVTIEHWPLPTGLAPESSTLLVLLPPGFNDVGPDMFWFGPNITTLNGGGIPGTQASANYFGRSWQRWSRHIGGQWRPGIDNLATYLAYIRRCCHLAAEQAA